MSRALLGGKRGAGRSGPGNKRSLRVAAALLAGVAVLSMLSSAVLGASGAVPTAPVFIGLDVDNYYFWQMIFILPLIFAVWVLASAVLMAFGAGSFDRRAVLAEAAVAWGLPLLFAWVPSAVQAALMALGMGQAEWVDILSEPGLWQALYLATYAAAAVWAVAGFIRIARTVHTKSWPAALATGLTSAVLAVGTSVLFIR
ncbi:MAG: hypothetical protein JW775_07810 [Candidatus Aminicenantes bacterium]|nr:hypothetical protein [Candidatus Aminicenantes bacterium]